jgi:hypothetical protein
MCAARTGSDHPACDPSIRMAVFTTFCRSVDGPPTAAPHHVPMNVSPVVQTIAAALTPYLGQMMARTSIEGHCKRLGLDISKLDSSQLESLLHQIGLGLNVFIGRDKSESVMRELRASIGRQNA